MSTVVPQREYMLPLEIFLQIVNLFQSKVSDLENRLAQALANDASDAEAIAQAQNSALEAQNKLNEIQAMYDAYKAQDANEDTQLLDAMNAVLATLQPTT